MKKITRIKKNHRLIVFQKLVLTAAIIGFLSALLGNTLKKITEHYESIFFTLARQHWMLYLLFPILGFSIIYFLRQTLFRKKENKGIKEIYESTDSKTKHLPAYKVSSHFINGLITVIFGGSTGIEVSTVVASAAIGSVVQQKENLFKRYKTQLICAGIASGITALFGSPIAGLIFAYEVISRKWSRSFLLTNGVAVAVAFAFTYFVDNQPLFSINVLPWHLHALPYMILLGMIAGVNAVYLNRCVMLFKQKFAAIDKHHFRIIIGAGFVSLALILFPQLYGEGYHAVKELISQSGHFNLSLSFALTLLFVILLKPIVTSLTLVSGGDGGVFAPSLFIGAFLGLLTASVLNTYFNAGVLPVNFMVIGMAAMLSASIHAPFTALFLVCEAIGDYTLFFPILIVCLISKTTAKLIYPYTVYSYSRV
ncbi:chloride channel protein [Flavobacterium cerinum]|uniref:Chloride channel protein n=1 Tax=Flavobacterium cerinum TaxID=2502784 RepID=A0ABY5IR94_9FLAO|nr:chloride channel protein [Flavobacterium cerinum]UUC45338.1 chloride channel protein [Flavobacterium cerinum]